MTLRLYYHPFSSFCQKVLVALAERSVPFEREVIDLGDPDHRARLEALWPLVKFPVLRDESSDRTVAEASLIVEYLDRFGEAPPLVPHEPEAGLRARHWDRVFDLYVDVPMQKAVTDILRPEDSRDPFGVSEARKLLVRTYDLVEAELAASGTEWIAGDAFSMADCAAAPALLYSNIVEPFAAYPHLDAYYRRLRGRPSFAGAVEEARPFRYFFPLGWPEGYDGGAAA